MKTNNQEMIICLWFDDQAEDAAKFYSSVFHDSELGSVSRFGKEGFEFHHKPEGAVMTVDFRLNRMKFLALNGGPEFKFNEAISVVVHCDTQDEIDHYWTKLTEEGEEGPCGWLKDKYGVSWQIVPKFLMECMTGKDKAAKGRVVAEMFKMKKLELDTLRNAFNSV